MHAHRLPAPSSGLRLGAALGVVAVAASLSTREIARVNAAVAREELFARGWSFTEPRLVLLPGRMLANGGFQLAGCNWPSRHGFGVVEASVSP